MHDETQFHLKGITLHVIDEDGEKNRDGVLSMDCHE